MQILELRAQPDELPELDRRYRVTLFDPQQGATLASNQTTCKIVIRENDSPFGYFRVYPRGVRLVQICLEIYNTFNHVTIIHEMRGSTVIFYV